VAPVVGQGLSGPRLMTPLVTTPAQGPRLIDQARSPTAMVLLAPSMMSAIRTALLRNITPLPSPSLLMPVVVSDSSPPTHAA